ncbi:hypothetical protein [Paramicrobacterium chengjingii]|uniref:Uncharacterized protein n=1 Tax=Paramicrobacterium chengjingii TaxID=2769067 RepID=A0ABX6YLT8_9MICO|nr:hypothetical protein [Microbacterium chengjingii]QPZ39687.1 hypothetical protein HCR76_06480 [Microbacterium chengjingii]
MSHPAAAPVEWVIKSAREDNPIAYVRMLHLGPQHELYFRAVTYSPHHDQRRLLGYWGSLEEAIRNIHHIELSKLPAAWLATGGATTKEIPASTPQKPPPV